MFYVKIHNLWSISYEAYLLRFILEVLKLCTIGYGP